MQPPPRLSAPAFAAASAAARRLPPSHRHPTVHLAVILGSAPVPLLRHAHALLILLSHKGFQVFLQTEVDSPTPPSINRVTHKAIPNLVATSPSDFFLLVADQNLSPASAQVCFPNACEFVQIHVADLPDALFTAWTRQLRAHSDHISHLTLAANPNVLTSAHLETLLQTFSVLPNYRHSYASLHRTAALTNNWPPFAPPTTAQHSLQQTTRQEPRNLSDISHAHSFQPEPSPESSLHCDESQIVQPESAAQSQIQLRSPTLTDKALRRGLRAVMRLCTQTSYNLDSTMSSSQLSFCWLRHSSKTSARLLHAQLLAAALHRNLLSTFETVSSAPITTIPTLHPRQPCGIQTDVHRQRLLREVNELLPRVEELGTRLMKRPSRKRRRTKFFHNNPWSGYLKEITALAISGKEGPSKIATRIAESTRPPDSASRCIACRSYIQRQAIECPVCHTEKCVPLPEVQLLRESPNVLQKTFQEIVRARQSVPTPWIFAPGMPPVQPLMNGSIPNGIMHFDHDRRSSKLRSQLDDKMRSFPVAKARTGSLGLRVGVGMPSGQPNDLALSMEALSFEGRNRPPGDNPSTGRGQSDHNFSKKQTSTLRGKNPANSHLQYSPHRLAVSAPTGPSILEVDVPKRAANGGGYSEFEYQYGPSAQILRSSPPSASNAEDIRIRDESACSLQVGSLPNTRSLPSDARLDANQANHALAGNLVSNSDHYDSVELDNNFLKSLKSQGDSHTESKTGFHRFGLEEWPMGSYETEDKRKQYLNAVPRAVSQPIAVPGVRPKSDAGLNGINSLEALAAASDAANGGTGSATRESLRAVSAVVTPGRTTSSKSSSPPMGNMYNMF